MTTQLEQLGETTEQDEVTEMKVEGMNENEGQDDEVTNQSALMKIVNHDEDPGNDDYSSSSSDDDYSGKMKSRTSNHRQEVQDTHHHENQNNYEFHKTPRGQRNDEGFHRTR